MTTLKRMRCFGGTRICQDQTVKGNNELKAKSIINTIDKVMSKTYQDDQREDDMRRGDAELHRICRESAKACLRAIVEHIYDFLDECCGGALPVYEDWIQELHPENVIGTEIDHRFYIEESDHRIIWNEVMVKKSRKKCLVPPRTLRRSSNSRD